LRYGENPHQSACVYKDSLDKSANILNDEEIWIEATQDIKKGEEIT